MAWAVPKLPTAFANDKSSKATATFKDAAHLDFIRKLPSIVSGRYGCEACHIRAGSGSHNKKRTGMAQKPSDCWTLPLTPDEHREQHAGNEVAYWARHGIDPFTAADTLYKLTGDFAAAKIFIAGLRNPLWNAGTNHEGD